MPDITKCLGTDCPQKETCYRYKAKPSDYQSYFMEAPKQERMYSEQEVLNILYKHTEDLLYGKKMTLEKWFKQFKKK